MSGTTAPTAERSGRSFSPSVAQARFRPELQGVRALASVLVVVYHVWLDRISGGVDVFFLVSGFLITGQLYRASLRGRIELRPMWGRMVKRLLPAAMTVLLAVVVASALLLPEDRWFQTIREVFASALFYENWQLAADSVDYFARHNTASVVQHFWSLSIQGQFYL
ncbi:MAG: acyltransferase family protein, partial [Acidimicrobiales bacterium]